MERTILLQQKLDKEYEDFIEELKNERVDVIVERAYELVVKQSIMDYIQTQEMTANKINALLKEEKLLNSLYNKWMESDGEFYTIIGEKVEEKIRDITNNYQKKIIER